MPRSSFRDDARVFISAPASAPAAADGAEARVGGGEAGERPGDPCAGPGGPRPAAPRGAGASAGAPASSRGGWEHDQRRLLSDAADLLSDYLDDAADPAPPVVRLSSPAALREAFREAGVPLDIGDGEPGRGHGDVMRALECALRYSVRTHSPLFHNQLSARADPVGVVGDWVAGAAHAPVHTYEVSPVFTEAERAVLGKMARCVGGAYAEAHDGLFVPGGSLANLYGLLLARHRAFPGSGEEGLSGLPRMAVLCSEHAHFSVRKSCTVMGLGARAAVAVPCDGRGRLRPGALAARVAELRGEGVVPLCVVATAGSTVLGGFDPLGEVRRVCDAEGLWMHVDACWGGSLLLSRGPDRGLLAGVEAADSVAWSPHKMLGAPLQCSAVLTRHPGALSACNATGAAYLYQPDKLHADADLGDKSIQCSRRADAFKLWLMWKARGDAGLSARVDRALALAAGLERVLLEHPSGAFRLVAPRSGANVCFWVLPGHMRGAGPGAGVGAEGTGASEEWVASLGEADRAALAAVAPRVKRRMQEAGDAMVGYQPLGALPPFFRMVVANGDGVDMPALEGMADRMAYEHSAGL